MRRWPACWPAHRHHAQHNQPLHPPPQVCRIYCHKVVKLSDAVQPLPKQTTEFVHGVAESFLDVGQKKAQPPPEGGKR